MTWPGALTCPMRSHTLLLTYPRFWSLYLMRGAQIAKFMGPTWGPPGSCRPQMGPVMAPWILLSRGIRAVKLNCWSFISAGLLMCWWVMRRLGSDCVIHRNRNVIILTKFLSLAALKVVILTTFSAASDENFVKIRHFRFSVPTITKHGMSDNSTACSTSSS